MYKSKWHLSQAKNQDYKVGVITSKLKDTSMSISTIFAARTSSQKDQDLEIVEH